MKKLSKILVIVLTLALLLGVVVISASAQKNDIDFIKPDGTVVGDYTTLVDAITAANANTDDGNITIRINKAMSLDSAVTITRPATYGKVILDLNGYTLSSAVVATKSHVMDHVPSADAKGYLVNAKVNVKIEAADGSIGTATAYSVYGLALTGAYLEGDESKTPVATYEVGKTYVCTKVESGNTISPADIATGVITIADGANLEVDGKGGSISLSANSNVFEIGNDAPNAKLLVKDVIYSGGLKSYFCKINSGSATVDSCALTRSSESGLFRHGGNAELNILNSYIVQSGAGAANTGLIIVEGTGTADAADGYHVEIKNSTIISANTMISGVHPNLNTSTNVYKEITADKAADKVTRSYWSAEEARVEGVDYVNTDVLVENCNVENANFATKAKNDNGGIVGVGANMNVDFKKSNLFVAQVAVRFVYGTLVPSSVTLNDCYVEFTGKGYLHNAWSIYFVASNAGATIGAYNTEFRVGELIKENDNPGIKATSAANYTQNMTFGAGCLFDNACAPTAAANLCELVPGDTETYIIGPNSDKLAYITLNNFNNYTTTEGSAIAPHIVMANGAGSIGVISGSRITFTNMVQGRFTVETEANGNQYVCYDPTYVKNDMTGLNYVDVATDSSIANIVNGAKGAWQVSGAYTYLNTDDNANDAEYVLVGGNWVEVPTAYTKLYDVSGGFLSFDIDNHHKATDYDYISYSFDYKTPAEGENGLDFSTGIQWRRNHSGAGSNDQTNRKISFSATGALTVNGKSVSLEKDTWYTITVIVEVIETYAGENAGYYYADNKRSDMTFANSVAHVFVDGVKVSSYTCGYENALYICGLRGASITSSAACTTNSKFKIDNLSLNMYKKGYSSAELDAVLANSKGNLNDWSDYVETLENNKITERPADAAPVAQIKYSATTSWAPSSSLDKTTFYPGTTVGDVTTYKLDSLVKYDNVADAIAHGKYHTVELLADAEKVLVNTPATVMTNGHDFTYYSNDYKGTVANGIVTFAKADESDLVEITYSYGGEVFTETFIDGGYFWLDTSKIPEDLEIFDATKAQELTLYYNGKKLDAINPADYEAGYKVVAEASFIFSYELEHQYGWIITDNNGNFLYPEDKGDTYAELVNRVKTIENKFWDPFANDKDGVPGADLLLDANGKVTDFVPGFGYGDYSAISHTLDGYTVKLFKDYTHTTETPVDTLIFNSFGQANKIINYDLNGHTVKYGGVIADYRKTLYAWEYDITTGAVTQLLGVKTNGEIDHTAITRKDGTELYAVVKSAANTYAIHLISSTPGATVIANNTLILNSAREHLKTKAGTWLQDSYAALVYLGNQVADANAIGPDSNAINVQTSSNIISNAYNHYIYVRNLNVVSSSANVISTSGGYNHINNCNFISTVKNGAGMIFVGSAVQDFDITNSNIVSYSPQKLFSSAGLRNGTDKTLGIGIFGSRIYNAYLDANTFTPAGSCGTLANAINFGKDCYYNLEFNPSVAEGSIKFIDDRSITTEYEKNVYANETFKINGADYTFAYKVTDKVYTVEWKDASGATLDTDNYAEGGNPIYLGANKVVDALSAIKYVFSVEKVTGNAIYTATEKLIPAFRVSDSLVLESNLVHKIRIYKLVGGEDILNYITKISLGGEVYFDKAASVNNLEVGETEDGVEYYYILLNVKSNEIAKESLLEIEFKNLSENEIKASQNFSILGYIKRGFANCEYGSDLYNLYASVLKYGSAAYDNFVSDADEKAALDSVANQYPIDVTVPNASAGNAGNYIDVEFVLDANVEYRLYFKAAALFEIYQLLPEKDEKIQTVYDLMQYNDVTITYTNYKGATVEVSFSELEYDEEKGEYWVDFAVPAYEFNGDISVTFVNGIVNATDSITYNIANYYADVQSNNADNAKLLALVEGLYAYTSAAKTYVANKNAN